MPHRNCSILEMKLPLLKLCCVAAEKREQNSARERLEVELSDWLPKWALRVMTRVRPHQQL